MRYFDNRQQAGQQLASRMATYKGSSCAILALSEGAVAVGAEIAKEIHSSLLMLSVKDVALPHELEHLASNSHYGNFNSSHNLTYTDLEEITAESRQMINPMQLTTFLKLNQLISHEGPLDLELLRRHTVIIVSDGILNGLSIEVAASFLHPILTEKVIVAAPICTNESMDLIRNVSTDFIYLDVVDPGFPLSHYYADDSVPGKDEVLTTLQEVSKSWKV